ncbi:MAG: replication-associated recombination protein A [Candidatus Kerfeldbacteria bacterium]|nr:replication-associated recombination protein A [Candidatus Kerfeldbacteria bacterium]
MIYSMDNLFTQQVPQHAPLAERMRPQTFDDFVGQEQLIGRDTLLRKILDRGEVPSMILWGPPGSGKTTLANIIANIASAHFVPLSAVTAGKAELKAIIEEAQKQREFYQKKTILFIDEIHRWNKAQQDALLPFVEKGVLTLIGATTENPSFEVNSALLSRCQVFVIKQLSEEDIVVILQRAAKEIGIKVHVDVLQYVATLSNGDARCALNTLEFAYASGKKITKQLITETVQKTFLYDKGGEQHYNLISALHKSMRASDPDAALYWLARMLTAGEDVLYIARRVVRFASEDVGNVKPNGLVLAVAAYQACHWLGMPECHLALAQAVDYLARAPKSRALDDAWSAIVQDIHDHPNEPVPMHLRNAPTKLMRDLGYGKREQESNLPKNLTGKKYFS